MTSYSKFNIWVYDYYITNCIPNQINSLSIPISEIDKFIAENDIKLDGFKEINCLSWSHLLEEKESIPQYFGLIALQCLAAFKMQNLNGITAANFTDRFIDLIGINDHNKINSLFSEEFNSEFRVQEMIWDSAVKLLEAKNIIIKIPLVRERNDRYVQFPKSQIVLNYEDLKEYKAFFSSIHKEFESISFEDFKKYYINNISTYKSGFKRDNNVKNDNQSSEIERKIKLKQIFDFYCSDDWIKNNENSSSKNKFFTENYIIKFNANQLKLYDGYHKKLDNLNNLIRKNRYMTFKQNKDYPDEYQSVNFISLNDNNIFLIYNSPANSNEIRMLKNLFSAIPYENNEHNILIFEIKNSDHFPDFFKKKLISDYPIELKGFKVSGEKKYFVNHPPKIHLKEDICYHIYYNKKRIDKDEMNRVGKYTISINGFSNYNFELVELPILDYPINDKTKSLEFSSLNYKDEDSECINGLLMKYKDNVKIETLTINNWIKTIKGSKINSDSQLLKTIAQSRNGKH